MFGKFLKKCDPAAHRSALGKWGEKQAEKHLRSLGLKTLTRNWRCNTGEIDLVMVAPDRTLVFVEVKTRNENPLTPPESALTGAKKHHLASAARYFLTAHNINNRPLRFDLVTVQLTAASRANIEHHPNAFTA